MNKQQFSDKIKKFVVDELSEFGYYRFKDIKLYEVCNNEYYYYVNIKTSDDKEKELFFKYDYDDDEISIALNEDNFEVVRNYDWTIRYFWMTLLKWEV